MKRQDFLKESLVHFLQILGDLIVINWLWFFCSLPVITVGPATCGMYSVMQKLARGEQTSPIKDFFRTFKNEFKSAFVLGIIAIVALGVTVFDAYFALQQEGLFHTLYIVVASVLGVITLSFICYVFPMQAMFQNPLKVQIKNAFSLAFVSPGKTIMMWLITVFPVLVALFTPVYILQIIGFLYMIFGFSGPAYLNSRLLRDIYDKVNGAPVVSDSPEEE